MGKEDLKKLMGNLQKKKKEEKPVEQEKPKEEKDLIAKVDTEVSEKDLVEAEEQENGDADLKKEEKEKEAQEVVEHEVAVLQNNGVYRREKLGLLKELVDIHKINTQVLLAIKNLIEGAKDGK